MEGEPKQLHLNAIVGRKVGLGDIAARDSRPALGASMRRIWFRSGRSFRGLVGCLLVVLPQTPLSVPGLKTAAVKPNRSPVVATDQTHRLSRRDRGTASIAGLPEPGAVPQLNRALAGKPPFLDPVSDELSDDIRNHSSRASHICIGAQ